MKNIALGKNHCIDDSAVLGYTPGRRIRSVKISIGDNARIRSNTVIYSGVSIGDNLETGHNVVIREENRIGNNFTIWSNSVVDYGCQIGNNVKIHCNVYIAQYTIIEDDVFLAPSVAIVNDPHPICTKCMKGPLIKRGARIGANVTLLSHVVIGECSLIGAGSVVTKDVPPKSLVVGNPARWVKSIDDLECPLGIVDKPYKNGIDVSLRDFHSKSFEEEEERK